MEAAAGEGKREANDKKFFFLLQGRRERGGGRMTTKNRVCDIQLHSLTRSELHLLEIFKKVILSLFAPVHVGVKGQSPR